MVKKGTKFSRPGGTGFGVRLLDEFVKKTMNNFQEINLYYVKSDFNYIVNSLVKKLRDKKVIVNLSSELEMKSLDKYLWTKEKNEFLPHKTFTEKLYAKG